LPCDRSALEPIPLPHEFGAPNTIPSTCVCDEVFIAYAIEATHLRLFIGQFLTLLTIELLPDGTTMASP
jgi:hypothetical protein